VCDYVERGEVNVDLVSIFEDLRTGGEGLVVEWSGFDSGDEDQVEGIVAGIHERRI
jgi:hypothetical protein